MNDGFSVVIPVYNEATIGVVVPEVLEECRKTGLPFRVIVCDDGSDVVTKTMEETLARLDNVSVRYSVPNRGKGAILNEVFPEIETPFAVVIDADREYSAGDIHLLLGPLLSGQADWVMGARYGFGRPRPPQYIAAYFVNRMLTALFSALSRRRFSDLLTGLYAFRSACVGGLSLRERRFAYTAELMWKVINRTNPRFIDVPVSYRFRTYRQGKTIKWWEAFSIFAAVIRYRRAR